MICVLMVASGAAWESAVLNALSEQPDVVVLKRCVDVDDLLAAASAGQAQVAVVALDSPGLDTTAVEQLRRQRVRPIAVVGGSVAAVDQGRMRATRLGIPSLVGEHDLSGLVAEVNETADAPDPAVPDLLDGDRSPDDATPGRVVAVWGPAGAPGRTTLALGLAAHLAQRREPVTLVDADPHAASVAQHLGILDEVSGLLSAARLATSGLLEARLTTVQRALGPNLRVVTGLPRPDRWSEVRAGTVESLLEALRPRGHAVIDTGFSLEEDPAADFGARPGRNSMTLGALAVADEVVVIGSADPVGLSRLARALVELRDVLAGAPVRVVVNRTRASLGWSERDITGMVEGFARTSGIHYLPDDRAATDRALIAGATLLESGDSALSKAIAEVAAAVLPDLDAPPRRRLPRLSRPARPSGGSGCPGARAGR